MESDATLSCWNVAGRIRRLAEQQAEIVGLAPDTIGLQENHKLHCHIVDQVLRNPRWRYLATAESGAAIAAGRSRPRIALTAARAPNEELEIPGIPWPGRVVATRIGGLLVVNVHSPTSPRRDWQGPNP